VRGDSANNFSCVVRLQKINVVMSSVIKGRILLKKEEVKKFRRGEKLLEEEEVF